ncbi:MFS transporter [uncultured Muribaculum sp.]|uniref:MFS transporter n=1 Tax=uncultured Muribaculum sp. TaxID=1918613 RepID=UPI0025D5710D|nr:MFS transporter [uncultured Muribaculum sp.]
MNSKKSPITWIPTAYFAMGLPFVVLNMVAVLMYTDLGVDTETITFWTSLILMPWTFKFLWSPFMEIFGTKKVYVVTTQIVSGAAFGCVALALGFSNFFAVTIALLAVVAFSGATHDVACDGVYMGELSSSQQSKYIGWQGAFYNIAKIVGTGLLVYLAGALFKSFGGSGSEATAVNHAANQKSWMIVMLIISATMILIGIYHIFFLPSSAKSAKNVKRSGSEVMHELGSVLMQFFGKRHIWYYIAFIILYRFAEGFVVKIVPIFLKDGVDVGGLGLSNEQIGLYYGTCGAATFVLGSLLAGYYISARGLKKTLFSLALIFNLPFVVYTLFAIFQPSNGLLIATGIGLEYFGYGFGFVGLTLFMMQQVAPGKHQMAHYAFASGIMNFGVMLPGMLSGFVLNKLGGYENFFIFVLVATIVPLLITWFVPFKYNDDGTPIAGAVEESLTDEEGTLPPSV